MVTGSAPASKQSRPSSKRSSGASTTPNRPVASRSAVAPPSARRNCTGRTAPRREMEKSSPAAGSNEAAGSNRGTTSDVLL